MDLVCISASARSIWCHGYVLLFLLNNHLIVFYFAVDYCFLLAGLWFLFCDKQMLDSATYQHGHLISSR